MQRLLLIDADFILFKTCYNSVLSETERMYGIKKEKSLQETLDLIDWYLVEKIFKPTNANYYLGFLGGEGNYRYSIDSGYKAGRSTERPPYFKEAKQYLVDKYKFVLVDGIEAEDAVGICLSEVLIAVPDEKLWGEVFEKIIVHQDHDLNQLPGVHYNPVKDGWNTISEEQARYNFNLQLLTGCKTDKVEGLKKGVGEVKAKKILDELTKGDDRVRVVIAYIKEWGLREGGRRFKQAYKLLRILREKEDFIIPEIQSINKEVKLIDTNDLVF